MITILPLLLTTGCSGAEQVDVYLFLLGQQQTLSEAHSLSHNFTGAYEPEDTSEWTRAEDTSTSAQALFGELVTMADGTALLQVAGSTYPGTGDKGVWSFAWEDFERGDTVQAYGDSYLYSTEYENSRTDTIALTEGSEPGTFTGTWTTSVVNHLEQAEDDTWSVDVGLSNGQIVIGGQLLVEDDFGTERTASNAGQETDCDGSPCLLSVKTTTDTERTVQAVLTDYSPEDLEQDVDDYGQAQGY